MPRVVKIQQDRVGIQPTQALRAAQPISATGDLAKGLGDLAAGLQQRERNIDTAYAEQAATNFEREKNDLFFNPESGFLNKSGQDAFEGAEGVKVQLQELKKKYSEGLSPAAQAAFGKTADAHITRSNVDIDRHSSKNLKAWEVANINASIENTLENAQLYWNDAEQLEQQRALGRQAIHDAADISGESAEAVNEKLQNFDSSFTSNAIRSALSTGAGAAESALEKAVARKLLEPQDITKLKAQIQNAREAEQTKSQAEFSIAISRQLVEQVGDQPNAKSLGLQELKKIKDPKQFKSAQKEFERQLKLKRDADDEQQASDFDSASKFIANDTGDIETWKALNPSQWNNFTAKQQKALESGENVKTDWDFYADLSTKSTKEIANTPIAELVTKLAEPELKAFAKLKIEASKGQVNQAGRSRIKQTSDFVSSIVPGTSDKDKIKRNQIFNLVDQEARSRAEKLGVDELDVEDYNKVLNDFTKQAVLEGTTAFGLISTTNEVDFDELDSEVAIEAGRVLNLGGIEASTQTLAPLVEALPRLKRLLQKKNKPVTDENLMQLYNALNKK